MRNRSTFKLLVAVPLVLMAMALPATASAQSSDCGDVDAVPSSANIVEVGDTILCLINGERSGRGLPPLTDNSQLRKGAQNYSRKMVRLGFFDHVCPMGSTLNTRVRGTSYLKRARSWSLGENIAWGSGELATPAEIMQSWMESDGHRRNILSRGFRNIGIGVALGAPEDVQGMPAATITTDFATRSFR